MIEAGTSVLAWRDEHAPGETVIATARALELASDKEREHIERAAGLAGDGDGYGNGYGDGNGNGDG